MPPSIIGDEEDWISSQVNTVIYTGFYNVVWSISIDAAFALAIHWYLSCVG